MLSLNVATITPAKIEQLTGGLDQQRKEVRLARSRTMTKVMKYADGLVRKSLSSQTGLPQKAFKGRVITRHEQDGSEGLVWIGAYRITPYRISKSVLQTKIGIRAGKTSFPGAFKPYRDSSDKRVFIRKDSAKFDSSRYTSKAFGSGPGFPVVPVAEDVEFASEEAINLNAADIENRFDTIFQQELNFAINVEGK